MGNALLLFSDKIPIKNLIDIAEKYDLDVYNSWFNVEGLVEHNSVFLLNNCRDIISRIVVENINKKYKTFDEYAEYIVGYAKNKINKLYTLSQDSDYQKRYENYQKDRRNIHEQMDVIIANDEVNCFGTIEYKRLTNQLNYLDAINSYLFDDPNAQIRERKEIVDHYIKGFSKKKLTFDKMKLFFEEVLSICGELFVFCHYGATPEVGDFVEVNGRQSVCLEDLKIDDLFFLEANAVLRVFDKVPDEPSKC